MEAITRAIVLRKTPYTASTAIVAMYTERYGQASYMVRGLGRKSGKNAAIQPLVRVEVDCDFRSNKDLHTAKSVHLEPRVGEAVLGPVKTAISLFVAEVLYKALREEAPDAELYEFIHRALEYFEGSGGNTVFHLRFMAGLTRFLGFPPAGGPVESTPYFDLQNGEYVSDPNSSLHTLSAEASAYLNRLYREGIQGTSRIPNRVKRDLLTGLAMYYRIHLEGFGELKSLPVLMELFSAV